MEQHLKICETVRELLGGLKSSAHAWKVLLHTVDHLSAYVPSLQALPSECYHHLGDAVPRQKFSSFFECFRRSGVTSHGAPFFEVRIMLDFNFEHLLNSVGGRR